MSLDRSAGQARGARFARVAALLGMLLGLAGLHAPARAQVALDTYKPAPLSTDGFALSRPQVLERGTFQLQGTFDYANDPLLLKLERANTQRSIVHHHLVLHLASAIALGRRVTVFASLPVHLVMRGTTPGIYVPRADGAGIGDLALGGRFLLLGQPNARGMLSAEMIARVPTAQLANSSQSYSGDEIGSYEPALLGSIALSRLDLHARIGGRFRKRLQVGDLTLGQEVVYGLGAGIRMTDTLHAHVELYGSAFVDQLGDEEVTPLELLAGLKWQVANVNLGAAGGLGLLHGYGSPDARALLVVAYAPTSVKAAPPVDTDGDGLVDAKDACPSRPEDRDGFQDADGCPDEDNDRDQIPDSADNCPLVAEDHDGHADQDGCPEDEPVVPVNKCALDPVLGAAALDPVMCPDLDADGDTVLNRDDACPKEPGAPTQRGCPLVEIDSESRQLTTLTGIAFATNRHEILAESETLLAQMRDTLEQHPELARIRIEGHTDDVGRDLVNLDLSKRRAGSVARWLIAHGIEKQRLEAWGCGETRPLSPNVDETSREKNRRVEFHVLAADETQAPARCIKLPLR